MFPRQAIVVYKPPRLPPCTFNPTAFRNTGQDAFASVAFAIGFRVFPSRRLPAAPCPETDRSNLVLRLSAVMIANRRGCTTFCDLLTTFRALPAARRSSFEGLPCTRKSKQE